jgi:hypothetical protein
MKANLAFDAIRDDFALDAFISDRGIFLFQAEEAL